MEAKLHEINAGLIGFVSVNLWLILLKYAIRRLIDFLHNLEI